MKTETVLNARDFDQKTQQALVLSLFDGLREGQSFLLVTERDPSGLCQQLDSLQAPHLHWEYVRKADGEWKLRIAKLGAAEAAMNQNGGCCGMCGGGGHE